MKVIVAFVQYLFATAKIRSVASQAIRTHRFKIKVKSVSLAETLPSHERPKIDLPDRIYAAVIVSDSNNDAGAALVGPPIHVVEGDNLNVILENEITTGASLHFHGFSFSNAFEYAGAVGVSQCPLAKGESFAYNIAVNESPGTYWYHTEAGRLNYYDAIRGPLIVHPKGSEMMVGRLNTPLQFEYNKFAYDNERILFFQDGFVSSPAERYLKHVGNLLPPASRSDDGFVVATSKWKFGTCNGKLREVITVEPNRKYKFRLINGGEHFALRFSINKFPLTVVAADSNPTEPYTVDSVVLHVGERFDIEVNTHHSEDDMFWILVDTLGSQRQGYENGIRAILRVSSDEILTNEDVLSQSSIESPTTIVSERNDTKVLNCYRARDCIPITALSPLASTSTGSMERNGLEFSSGVGLQNNVASEIHFVETHFQAVPQYAHFVRVDKSYWIQNDFPPAAMISRGFRPENSVHPHSVPLELGDNSTVIIVWRTTLLMDHPVHLHGHTVEILDVSYSSDCHLSHCELHKHYSMSTLDKLRQLDKTTLTSTAVMKDTFIIPAGGAVVTRLRTGGRGLWLAQGQMDVHRQDGMSFVLNVGGYRIPRLDDWLPDDFPSCNTSLIMSQSMNPACECFVDKDRPHLFEMSDKFLCSRTHLCFHDDFEPNLQSYSYERGFSIQSSIRDWEMPGLILLLSLALILVVALILMVWFKSDSSIKSRDEKKNNSSTRVYKAVVKRNSSLSISADNTSTTRSIIPHRRSTIDFSVGSIFDGLSYIGTINDEGESEGDEIDCYHRTLSEKGEELSENGVRSVEGTKRRRRLSSVAASIENRLDRALGSILIERGDEGDGTDSFGRGFNILPDGYLVKGKLVLDPFDSNVANCKSPFVKQVNYIFHQQIPIHFSSSCNLLRVVEVCGVALLIGQVFRQDLSEASEATVSEMVSLILLINIVWTFSRLYSVVPLQNQWFQSLQVCHKNRRFSLPSLLFARFLVTTICECFWPAVYCFISYTTMSFNSDWTRICSICLLISLNNMCYIALGSVCALVRSVSYGMILATMMSQISVLISGVFVRLPTSIEWLNRRSPFFWAIRGLLKCTFRWTDNYQCLHGSSESEIEGGLHQCFVEESLVLDQLQQRGIYDPSSSVIEECMALLILFLCLLALICIRCVFSFYRIDWHKIKRIVTTTTA